MSAPAQLNIERGLVAAFATALGDRARVTGFIEPAARGVYKTAPRNGVEVKVDKANQLLDIAHPRGPLEFAVEVTLAVAVPDDKEGLVFAELYALVDAAMLSLTGDGCAALSATGFTCDAFMYAATASGLVDDDCTYKSTTFTATLTGRITTQNEQE